jgi:hypothetical protein
MRTIQPTLQQGCLFLIPNSVAAEIASLSIPKALVKVL